MTEYKRLTGMIFVLLVLLMLLIVMVMVAIQVHGEEDLPEGGGMPCEDKEAFAEWYRNYLKELEDEQETGKESEEAADGAVPERGPEAGEDSGAQGSPALAEDPEGTDPDDPEVHPDDVAAGHAIYTVNGTLLSPDLQNYLYDQLAKYGKQHIFPISLCQLYQESRYNFLAVAPNGLDKGLCQFRETYFPLFAQESGLVQYDIFNPIDSLYVYAYLMSKYIDMNGGDIYGALSMYFTGPGGAYCDQYVHDVMQWQGTMREVQDAGN